MSRINIPPIPPATKLDELIPKLRVILNALELQLGNQIYISSRNDTKRDQALKRNDIVIRFIDDALQIGIYTGKQERFLQASDLQVLQSNSTNFKGRQTGTNAVTHANVLALFPTQNDWGFYDKTDTSNFYLVYNVNGSTLKSEELT